MRGKIFYMVEHAPPAMAKICVTRILTRTLVFIAVERHSNGPNGRRMAVEAKSKRSRMVAV